MQYLRILFYSFGEEDFQRFCIKLSMFKLFLAIILTIIKVGPPFCQFLKKLDILKDYLFAIFKNSEKIFKGLANRMSGTKGIQPLLADPTQVESKNTSQIQWPLPSIKAELVEKTSS